MRFYIINQAISLLLVSSAFALRGSSVGNYNNGNNGKDKLSFARPDGTGEADLDGMVDIGILSAATTDVLDQYEADREDETILAAGLGAVFTSISVSDKDTLNEEATGNLRIPTLVHNEWILETESLFECEEVGHYCWICLGSDGKWHHVGDCH